MYDKRNYECIINPDKSQHPETKEVLKSWLITLSQMFWSLVIESFWIIDIIWFIAHTYISLVLIFCDIFPWFSKSIIYIFFV